MGPVTATLASWVRDFALGVRLAVGGGRTSWARLALGTVGIGLAVAVLLAFASVGHFVTGSSARTAAREPNSTVIAGVNPTQLVQGDMAFRGVGIMGAYVHGTGPNSPVPPGLTALPGPNEIVLSPALADLLDSDPGLRPRFPQKIVGTIGEAGLRGPAELAFYAGTATLPVSGPGLVNPAKIYSFGHSGGLYPADPTVMLVAIIGGGRAARPDPHLRRRQQPNRRRATGSAAGRAAPGRLGQPAGAPDRRGRIAGQRRHRARAGCLGVPRPSTAGPRKWICSVGVPSPTTSSPRRRWPR